MNFAKFLANSLRSRLCLQNPKAEQIEKIERLLGLAANLRNRIVCANTRLVASIAKRFAEDDSRFDDLISDGYLVLLRAVDKFDASRGFRFSTYATHAIRREFYHSLYRRKGNAVNLGDDAERAAAVDSLPEDESQESQLEQFRRYQWILNYIDSEFDARDQQILSLRFGVADDSAPQTLAKIGAKLGLSKERVRQLQIRAIEQLREAACNEYSDVSENSHDSA